MKILCLPLLLLACCFLLAAQSGPPDSKSERESVKGVDFTKVAPGTWLHTTYMALPEYPNFPANGVVVESKGEAIIVDLPSTIEATESLFKWVTQKGWVVKYVVPQHWHIDSSAGLPVAVKHGAKVAMLDKTAEILAKKGSPVPDVTFEKKLNLKYGERVLELAHYGGGHSIDSVVAWVGDEKVLVGGCLIKSANAKSLGNVADADMKNYASTVKSVKRAYPDVATVTPGHGSPGGGNLLDHTIELREKLDQ